MRLGRMRGPSRSARNFRTDPRLYSGSRNATEASMNGIIYLIGLIVVIMAILSFFGLR